MSAPRSDGAAAPAADAPAPWTGAEVARALADRALHRRVWWIAAPIILSNVSVPVLHAVDTAVVGHLPGPEFLAGVAVAGVIFNILFSSLSFLRMGTTGLAAQAFGAGDATEVRLTLARALAVAAGLGVALIALASPLLALGLTAIAPPPEVVPHVETYFAIRMLAAPAALANLAFLGWFIAVQDTRAALWQQVAMNAVNLVLDLWFVLGLGWGVAGVAWATVIAEVFTVGLGLWFTARLLGRLGGGWDRVRLMDRAVFARQFAINRDIFIRTLLLQACWVAFTTVGARLGGTVLAANAVLFHFQSAASWALDGVAHAAEALVGEAVGGRERARLRAVVVVSTLWAAGFALALALLYALLGGTLIDVLTGVPEVRALAREFLPWAVASPLLYVWAYQLDGVFIGATRGPEMRNTMIVSTALFALVLALLVPPFANHGLWLAVSLLAVFRAATLARAYPRVERAAAS